MSVLFGFFTGVVVGVVYEKRIRKFKDAATRAASAAKSELSKG